MAEREFFPIENPDPSLLTQAEAIYETRAYVANLTRHRLIEGKGSMRMDELPLKAYSAVNNRSVAVARYLSSAKPVVFVFPLSVRTTAKAMPICPAVANGCMYLTVANCMWGRLIKKVEENLNLPEGYRLYNLYFGNLHDRKTFWRFEYAEPDSDKVSSVIYEIHGDGVHPKKLVASDEGDVDALGNYHDNMYSRGTYVVMPIDRAPVLEPDEAHGRYCVTKKPAMNYAKLFREFCVQEYYDSLMQEIVERRVLDNAAFIAEQIQTYPKDVQQRIKIENGQLVFDLGNRQPTLSCVEPQVEAKLDKFVGEVVSYNERAAKLELLAVKSRNEAMAWLSSQEAAMELLKEFGFAGIDVSVSPTQKTFVVKFYTVNDVKGGVLTFKLPVKDFLDNFEREVIRVIIPRYRNLQSINHFLGNYAKN